MMRDTRLPIPSLLELGEGFFGSGSYPEPESRLNLELPDFLDAPLRLRKEDDSMDLDSEMTAERSLDFQTAQKSWQRMGAVSPLNEKSYFQETPEVIELAHSLMSYCCGQKDLFSSIRKKLDEGHERSRTYFKNQQMLLGQSRRTSRPYVPDKFAPMPREEHRAAKKQAKSDRVAKSREKKTFIISPQKKMSGCDKEDPNYRKPCIMFAAISYVKADGLRGKLCLVALSGSEHRAPDKSDGTFSNPCHQLMSENWEIMADAIQRFNEANAERLGCKFYFLNHYSKSVDDYFLEETKKMGLRDETVFEKKCAEGKICHVIVKWLELFGDQMTVLGGVALCFFPSSQEEVFGRSLEVDSAHCFAIKEACSKCMQKKPGILSGMVNVLESSQRQLIPSDFSPTKKRDYSESRFFSPIRPHFKRQKVDSSVAAIKKVEGT